MRKHNSIMVCRINKALPFHSPAGLHRMPCWTSKSQGMYQGVYGACEKENLRVSVKNKLSHTTIESKDLIIRKIGWGGSYPHHPPPPGE
jgi:hypothetical protein